MDLHYKVHNTGSSQCKLQTTKDNPLVFSGLQDNAGDKRIANRCLK